MSDYKSLLRYFTSLYRLEIEFSKIRTLKIYLGLTVLVLILFGYFAFVPQYSAIRIKLEQLRTLDTNISSLVTKYNLLEEYRTYFDVNQNNISAVLGLLPAGQSLEDFFIEMVAASGESDVQVERVGVGEISEDRFQLLVFANAGASNLPEYLKKLENLSRITRVESVTLSQSDREGRFSINYIITVFVRKELVL